MTSQSLPSLLIKLHGILLPITTPFASNEAFDVSAFRSNITRWNTTGISGYAVLGSTGERVHLSEREYREVIDIAREAVPEKYAFIIGAGQQTTRGTIRDIEIAATSGADAVLVLTPFFYKPAITQASLVTHYIAVADAASIPVILYSMPALTGIKIEPESVAQLCTHPNIIGIKDSSADIDGLRKTVAAVREAGDKDFVILTGNGTVLFDALKGGADGGILAVACVAPDLCLEIFQSVKSNNYAAAQSLQAKLTPLAEAVTTNYGIGGLKAALDEIGYVGGAVRAPLKSPDESARREILELLRAAVPHGVR